MATYLFGLGLLALTVMLTLAAIAFAGSPPAPRPAFAPTTEPRRLRLRSRLLFARRTAQAITLDAVLVDAVGLPAGADATPGLPFAVAVRLPDTPWLAMRVDALLTEWSENGDVILFELIDDNGRLRTTIASGESSVHLDLADTAGLPNALAA